MGRWADGNFSIAELERWHRGNLNSTNINYMSGVPNLFVPAGTFGILA